ncbi:FAD-binding oxidoreductase [Streptacidiphilus rugosus]|uniref:FAD-binding oxidoreductase n=1 Tax=Streptacidiphilus rugosus TaxID=405783 RepID=UPI00055CD103|nr:FAD-binding oxidoreductase [Streptacidiphilus rugosus]
MDGPTLEAMGAALRGPVLTPDDPGYDQARSVYNAMVDKRPAALVRCADAADVMAAVDFVRSNGLDLAVLGGGHSAAGLGLLDDGVTIDLSPLRGVRVDPAARTAQVAGGCTLREVDHATHAFGLGVPTGVMSTTGIGGLALGGGHGHLTRRYGLTVDSLLSADVVLADGSFVTADEEHDSDLFWALRGGGGNFGVVTSFTFRLHPVDTVGVGLTLWPVERTREVLQWYRNALPQAPEEASGFFAVLTVPPGPPFPGEIHLTKAAGVVWCHTEGAEALDSLLDASGMPADPSFRFVAPMPYPMLQGMFDELIPRGLQWYWRGDFFDRISDEAAEVHARFGAAMPTMLSTMHLYPVDGAAHRVAPDATAWSYRDAVWSGIIGGVDPDQANAAAIKKWCVDYWQELHPHSMGGSYVNFIGQEEPADRVRATYRGHYARLAEVKRRYDPDNVFHANQNIEPAS